MHFNFKDNNEENFEAGKVLVSATLSNKYSFTNFRVENGKENSTVSSISSEFCSIIN